MNFFVTAIGTDSGKTVASAILVEMLQADYWKPIQCGEPRDTEEVKRLISNDRSRFYQESYFLKTPASPHDAAEREGVTIDLSNIHPPISNHDLVIEGAGGILVPLNDEDYVIDLVPHTASEIVLVANLYLGSINHTLLTLELLKQRKYPVKGIIFNGPSNPASERIILSKSDWKPLLHIQQEDQVDQQMIIRYADKLQQSW
ncbi:MAG: dethiobiotin synthase [Cyclobacteriaceae bacterium]|nr:dethiobiotin synthase [Cyclobacteriaceae bacterium HetDA_MAG_MS6]